MVIHKVAIVSTTLELVSPKVTPPAPTGEYAIVVNAPEDTFPVRVIRSLPVPPTDERIPPFPSSAFTGYDCTGYGPVKESAPFKGDEAFRKFFTPKRRHR